MRNAAGNVGIDRFAERDRARRGCERIDPQAAALLPLSGAVVVFGCLRARVFDGDAFEFADGFPSQPPVDAARPKYARCPDGSIFKPRPRTAASR
jgi:hypothetical protein